MQLRVVDQTIYVSFDEYNSAQERAKRDQLRDQRLFLRDRKTGLWAAEYDPGIILHLLDTFGPSAFRTDEPTKELCENLLRRDRARKKARAKFVELKAAKREDLDGFRFDHAPFGAHQRLALSLLKNTRVMALWADCGTGKTFILLHWIRYLRENVDSHLKPLVVAPLGILYDAWWDDAAKFTPELDICVLNQGAKESIKLLQVRDDADLYLINFEMLDRMLPALLEAKFNMVIVDESKMIANYKSKRTKAAIALGDAATYKAVASAIPAPNSELEYWSQYRFLSKRALGMSFSAFRSMYFMESGYGGYTFVPNPRLDEERKERMAEYSVIFRAEDCLDLPPELHHPLKVILPNPVMEKYRFYHKAQLMLLKNASGEDEIWTSRHALTRLVHLREIAGGFIMKRQEVWQPPTEDGEEGKMVVEEEIRRLHDEKVKALRALVERIDPQEQILVWAHFHEEFRMLAEGFPEATLVYGKIPKKKREEASRAFKAGDIRILIAQPASYKYGFTWTGCQRIVWYSLDWSLDALYQANKRTHRHGQELPCHYYYLLGYDVNNRPTIDQLMLDRLSGKYANQEAMLRDLMKTSFGDD